MLQVEALLSAAEIVAAAKGSVTFTADVGHSKQPKTLLTGKDIAETATVYCAPAAALDTFCQKETFAA